MVVAGLSPTLRQQRRQPIHVGSALNNCASALATPASPENPFAHPNAALGRIGEVGKLGENVRSRLLDPRRVDPVVDPTSTWPPGHAGSARYCGDIARHLRADDRRRPGHRHCRSARPIRRKAAAAEDGADRDEQEQPMPADDASPCGRRLWQSGLRLRRGICGLRFGVAGTLAAGQQPGDRARGAGGGGGPGWTSVPPAVVGRPLKPARCGFGAEVHGETLPQPAARRGGGHLPLSTTIGDGSPTCFILSWIHPHTRARQARHRSRKTSLGEDLGLARRLKPDGARLRLAEHRVRITLLTARAGARRACGSVITIFWTIS